MRYLTALFFIAVSLYLGSSQAATTVDDYPMQAVAIAANVYAVISPAQDFPNAKNKGWNSNAAFVVLERGVVLFDTGSSETIGNALLKTIRRVTDKPVRWVVNSHGHGDHWLGNGAFESVGSEIIASFPAREKIIKEGVDWVDRFKTMSEGATGDSKVVVPETVLESEQTLRFDELEVEVLFSGDSHSPGDIALWLPQHRIVLAGDTVFSQRTPATFDANIKNWRKFLTRLEVLQPAAVVPGHGPMAGVKELVLLREYFEILWAVVAEGYEAGLQAFEIIPKAREAVNDYATHFVNLDDRLGQTVSHIFLQVEQDAF